MICIVCWDTLLLLGMRMLNERRRRHSVLWLQCNTLSQQYQNVDSCRISAAGTTNHSLCQGGSTQGHACNLQDSCEWVSASSTSPWQGYSREGSWKVGLTQAPSDTALHPSSNYPLVSVYYPPSFLASVWRCKKKALLCAFQLLKY